MTGKGEWGSDTQGIIHPPVIHSPQNVGQFPGGVLNKSFTFFGEIKMQSFVDAYLQVLPSLQAAVDNNGIAAII